MAGTSDRQAEFSRLIPVHAIHTEERLHEIEAGPEERAALASRFELLSLDSLMAEVQLRRSESGPLIHARGHLSAEITQSCVVTLAPVRSRIEGDFTLLFTLAPQEPATEVDVVVDIEDEPPPDPIGPEGLDIGEMVAEQLALAIDPYPRAEGAALGRTGWGAERGAPARGPFAALEGLKPPPGKKSN